MDWDPKASAADGFICPPCPVFHPTAEEFQHPLKYISSIRHIGEQAGICKIVPPAGWRPPFALHEKRFRFRTRVQQLNCLDGHSRTEGNFVEALRLFLYRHNQPMKQLPRADGQLVNLHLLYKTVVALGGFDAVSARDQWEQVVRRVGRTSAASEPSEELCRVYQRHYKATLLAYELEQRDKDSGKREAEAKSEEVQATPSSASVSGAVSATPASKSRSSGALKRSAVATAADRDSDVAVKSEEEEEEGLRVKRTLFSDGEHTSSEENDGHASLTKKQKKPTQPKRKLQLASLEPEALKPPPDRKSRLGSPEIRVGQQFFQFFPKTGAVLAEVKRVFGGKKPHVAVRYVADGSSDDVELATMQILIANGWDAEAAELAFKSEICQACLRGDCWDRMLLCDGCNGGQHLFCLAEPLTEVPSGDWYCQACVEDAANPDERDANPKFGFDMGAEVRLMDYKERADAWKRSYFSLPSEVDPDAAVADRELETEYWRLLSIPVHEQRLEVQYGSDVDSGATGSGFPRLDLYQKNLRCMVKRWKNVTTKSTGDPTRQLSEFFSHGLREGLAVAAGGANSDPKAAQSLEELVQRYSQDDWNLNNLPKLAGSVLQHLDEDIKGVMVPWLYAGMCFSTFCWHVEDHNFYSTSYLHCGAPKTWYGVPSASAELFERTMKQLTPELFGSQPDLHMQLVTMFSPKTLREHGVPVYRATHRPNEFVVTFPSAYHAGFNNGFNCAEAVNFATVDWLPWGARSLRKYREYQKLPVFCHEALVCTLAETLMESSSFDAELAETYLLPAVQQLLEEYREFQRRVEDGDSPAGVAKRELIADFEKRQQHGAVVSSTDASASSMRRSMAARTCNKPGPPVAASTPKKPKPATSTASMRPTRMVLWAGRSGKNEGLRCVSCKQYCYLQAVVCTKCRPPHGSGGAVTVGCVEHYPTMCKCSSDEFWVYLYRYEASRLEEIIAGMRSRLDGVQSWKREFDAALGASGTSDEATKPSVRDLKQLLSRGKACGGAARSRLDALELAVRDAESWAERVEALLDSLKQEQSKSVELMLSQFETLLEEADSLAAVPTAIAKLREVVEDWRAAQTDAVGILKSMESIHQHEASSPTPSRSGTPSVLQALGVPSDLRRNNVRYGLLGAAIASVSARLRAKKESEVEGSLVERLSSARRFLGALCEVNALAAALVEQAEGAAIQAPAQSEVERVLSQVDELNLDSSSAIAIAEALRALLEATEAAALEVDQALSDRSKSTEELDVLLRRARAVAIPPTRMQELAQRLESCRSWERRAQQILDAVGGSTAASMAERPPLEDVEAFDAQADAHFVPSSSLLRRQVHARVQDCRRWYEAVHGLFLRPSNSQLPLAAFLQKALDKAGQQQREHRSLDEPVDPNAAHPHSQLHCVCQQVLSERAHLVTCQRCQRYFHPQCVRSLLPQRAGQAFVCASCSPRSRVVADAGPPLFCLCREVEQAPMICCDFCDEWYHGACVDLSPSELNRVEAFRCPRCSRRQQLYYLDKKLLRRECVGRRPALARVESFLTQLQTHLVARPPAASELVAYVHAAKRVERDADAFARAFALREFSAPAFATSAYGETQERAVVRLLERVTDLEVALDTAQSGLAAVHWCLRACQLVLGPSERAPRYSHLVALLQDAASLEPGLAFPREEYRLMQLTIADRVEKATRWLRAAKTLEVEEWNVEKARRLRGEYEELVAFLELPAAEVQLVHSVAASREGETIVIDEEKEEEEGAESPSTAAWKKQRLW